MALVPAFAAQGLQFNIAELESIILTLVERYDIRISIAEDVLPTAGLVVGLAALGGLLGFYLGGRIGMVTGAVGGAGGAVYWSLKDKWSQIKDKLTELYYIVYNYLRSLNIADYVAVGQLIYNCAKNRERLVRNMVEFIAMKLGTSVVSSIANSH